MPSDARWISVHDAAIIAHRSKRTIYDWIGRDLVIARIGDSGETEVDAVEVLEVEATRKRGRPPGG